MTPVPQPDAEPTEMDQQSETAVLATAAPAVEAERPVEASPPPPVEVERPDASPGVVTTTESALVPRRRWPVRLRWFSGQLLVVTTGILVAIALNAWWDARQDRAREQTYLRQLDADLAETQASVAGYDQFLRPVDRVAARLVRAYRSPTRPPADSLMTWLLVGSRFGVPRPVLGTAEALVATGELEIVRDDSLRTAIVAYLDYNRALLSSQDAVGEVWRQGFAQVRRRVDFSDVALAGRANTTVDSLAAADPYYEIPVGARRRPFPVDAAALLRDREVYEGLWTMNSSKRNLAQIRADMAQRATGLRDLVQSSLED